MELAVRARREAEDGCVTGRQDGSAACWQGGRPCITTACLAHPTRDADLDRRLAALDRARSAPRRRVLSARGRAAAAPARGRLRRALPAIIVVAAGLDRERRGDLGPLAARARSARCRRRILARGDGRALRAPGLSAAKIRTLRPSPPPSRTGLDLAALADMPRRRGPCARSPRSRASAPGRPTSISCSASAMPTPSRPATSRCRRRRGSPSTCRRGRRRRRCSPLAEAWRPWRGVAARLLWAYYRAVSSARCAPAPQEPAVRERALQRDEKRAPNDR